jgi:cytochrome c oxidase cbb3-type subunit 3
MANGAGGFIGADLSAYARGKSAKGIRDSLINPISDRGKAVVITNADGTQFHGIVRNEDNFSLQLQTSDGAFHFFEKSSLQRIERRPEPIMPTDYESRLSPQELNDVVSYLIQLGQSGPVIRPQNKNVRESRGSEE